MKPMKCIACSIKYTPVMVIPEQHEGALYCPSCGSNELEEVKK